MKKIAIIGIVAAAALIAAAPAEAAKKRAQQEAYVGSGAPAHGSGSGGPAKKAKPIQRVPVLTTWGIGAVDFVGATGQFVVDLVKAPFELFPAPAPAKPAKKKRA